MLDPSSIRRTPRVRFEVDSEIPYSHHSSIVERVVHFRYDGPIIISDTCASPLQHAQSWLVQERGRDAGGNAINVGDICGTDRMQFVGFGCGCWKALNRRI